MNTELRDRAVLPVLIPVAAIVVTEIVVFSMSQVLLAAGKTPAVVIAIAVALAILVGAAMIAARPRVKTGTIVGLLVVAGLGSVAAGAVAMQRGPAFPAGEHGGAAIPVTAADLAFDTETLEIPPEGAQIELVNDDSQPHNIAIYPSAEELNDPLFQGAIIQAGQTTTYDVGEITPGAYYFQCDVHPAMNGQAVVEEGAGSAEHEGAHESGDGAE